MLETEVRRLMEHNIIPSGLGDTNPAGQREAAESASSAATAELPTGRSTAGPGTAPDASTRSGSLSSGRQVLAAQGLFSVYVHTAGHVKLAAASVFSGCEVESSVDTLLAWGSHRLIEAELRLLRVALRNPANHKFVLVSPESVPLWPPHVVWAQLAAEDRSRVGFSGDDAWRATNLTYTKHLRKEHFFKSSQWFTLTRAHAALAVADTHVEVLFSRNPCSALGARCINDEHYFPALLAAYALQDQTDRLGESHYIEWDLTLDKYPRWFYPADLSPALLERMRARGVMDVGALNPGNCNPQQTITSAATFFDNGGRSLRRQRRQEQVRTNHEQGDPHQHLLTGQQVQQAAGEEQHQQPGPGVEQQKQHSRGASIADEATAGQLRTTAAAAHPQPVSGQRLQQPDDLQGPRGGRAVREWVMDGGYDPFSYQCHLFSRKFVNMFAEQTLRYALACDGLGFGRWCHPNLTGIFVA
ncbi:MAG: hypothetical protein WDW36_006859 [Sanguina aurantia]